MSGSLPAHNLLLWRSLLLLLLIECNGALTARAQNNKQPELTITPTGTTEHCIHSQLLRSIHVYGNKHTRTAVILREMSIKEGMPLCADSLAHILHLNYLRLYNLNLFTDIQLSVTDVDSNTIDLQLALKEQWFIIPQADVQLADRNFNVWWKEQGHDLSRINLGLYVLHKNLSGNMDRLSLSAHMGYTQQFTMSYFRPYIDRRQQQGLGFSAGFSRSKEIAYTSAYNKLLFTRHNNDFLYSNFFGAVSWFYRPAYHSRHVVGLAYQSYEVGDTVLTLNPDYFAGGSKLLQYAELNYRYEYNGVDNWNYPRRGVKLVGTAALRLGIKGMDRQAVAGIELGCFHKLSNHWYTSFVLRGRTTITEQQPYFLQSALGYKTNFVRGYEYYVVEADHFAIGRLSLKYEAIRRQFHHLPFRYLPELPLWIYPKVFFDAGYAANTQVRNSNTLANKMLYSVGLGVDIITAYDLKLRIEFAFNHLGENGIYLHANSE